LEFRIGYLDAEGEEKSLFLGLTLRNGAELAGLPRAEFIGQLGRANVSAIQTSVNELRDEMKLVRHAGR
jgi:hypothetical protein